MYKIKKEIGRTLKNKYLVDGLGLSNSYVSLLLNGKKIVPFRTAYAIASYLNKEVEELFEKVGK